MKQYKNPNELLEYIISKGVNVSNRDDALNKIKKYSYYSVVNSYKDIFKNYENNTYIDDVSFDEIYSLFEFDKNIRMIFLKYILEIEMIIKSLLAEVISSNYGIEDYLILKNFDDSVSEKTTKETINKINEEINRQVGKHEAVTHYFNSYGFVPPFVLTKILTLGELSRLYGILKQKDRQSISKEFKIPDKLLKQIMKNMTMVRNICAHNDRLFSFHSKFLISFKMIDKNYDNKGKSTNIYMIMKSMQCLLDQEKAQEFETLINDEILMFKNKVKSIETNKILFLMGFYNE